MKGLLDWLIAIGPAGVLFAAILDGAGLPIPAAEGSSAGFFDLVLSDVGDDQSLTKNLSTFSAHVRRLVSILEVAGARSMVKPRVPTAKAPKAPPMMAVATRDMRWMLVVLVCSLEILASCGETRRPIGDECLRHDDCLSGVCSARACVSSPSLTVGVSGPPVAPAAGG